LAEIKTKRYIIRYIRYIIKGKGKGLTTELAKSPCTPPIRECRKTTGKLSSLLETSLLPYGPIHRRKKRTKVK